MWRVSPFEASTTYRPALLAMRKAVGRVPAAFSGGSVNTAS